MNRQSTHTVLLVEDDQLINEFLCDQLISDGFDVLSADSLESAQRHIQQGFPDIVLCDVSLPDGVGYDLVSDIRAADGIVSRIDPDTPVIMLSGRDQELDRIRGFERGCDDYLVKPISYSELRLRIQAVLRRVQSRRQAGAIRLGRLELDPGTRRVTVAGNQVQLTQKEYQLLLALANEPLRVFSKDELLKSVWGYKIAGQTRTIDSHACRLRKKLGVSGDEFVVNIWGVGYRLVDCPSVSSDSDFVSQFVSSSDRSAR